MATEREILAFLKQVKDDPDLKEWVPFEARHMRNAAVLRADWVRRTPGQTPPTLRVYPGELARVQGRGWIEDFAGSYRITPAGEQALARGLG